MPWLPEQRCVDCGRKAAAKRCPPCQQRFRRRYEVGRPSRQERGYDAEYERNRAIVLERNRLEHGGLCNVCWAAEATTADHILPLEQGGTNDIGNLRAACGPCNYGKRGRAASKLRRIP